MFNWKQFFAKLTSLEWFVKHKLQKLPLLLEIPNSMKIDCFVDIQCITVQCKISGMSTIFQQHKERQRRKTQTNYRHLRVYCSNKT